MEIEKKTGIILLYCKGICVVRCSEKEIQRFSGQIVSVNCGRSRSSIAEIAFEKQRVSIKVRQQKHCTCCIKYKVRKRWRLGKIF